MITHKHIRMIAHKLSWKTAFLLGFRKRNTRARLLILLIYLNEQTQRLESLYQRKLTALDNLKKSLLHKAFAGEL